MNQFTCPVCGGKLNIRIGTEYAVCDSCGNVTKIDPNEAAQFTKAFQAAERSMRLNSVEGYEAALRELDGISFIEEARRTRADCQQRLRDLQADIERRQVPQRQDTSFAGVLLALTLVFCTAAFTGLAWLILRLIQGALPPPPRPSSSPSQRWRSAIIGIASATFPTGRISACRNGRIFLIYHRGGP